MTFETCRRAHVSHTFRKQHVVWHGRLPDEREGVTADLVSGETPWFRAVSSLGYQLPSTVLVEEVLGKRTVELPKKQAGAKLGKRKTKALQDKSEKNTILSPRAKSRTKVCQQKSEKNTIFPPKAKPRAKICREKSEKNTILPQKEKPKTEVFHGKCEGDTILSPEAKSCGVIRRLELTSEGFWEFLFSDRWEDTCLLRVLQGEVLENLLAALYSMEKEHDVISFVMMAYIKYDCPENDPYCKTATSEATQAAEQVLVELDYFSPKPHSPKRAQTAPPMEHLACHSPPETDRIFRPQPATRPATPAQFGLDVSSSSKMHPAKVVGGRRSSFTGKVSGYREGVLDVNRGEVQSAPPRVAPLPPEYARLVTTNVAGNFQPHPPTCDVRGMLRPPPHSDCTTPYHMVREPMQVRRYREGSAFPPLEVPTVEFGKWKGVPPPAKRAGKRAGVTFCSSVGKERETGKRSSSGGKGGSAVKGRRDTGRSLAAGGKRAAGSGIQQLRRISEKGTGADKERSKLNRSVDKWRRRSSRSSSSSECQRRNSASSDTEKGRRGSSRGRSSPDEGRSSASSTGKGWRKSIGSTSSAVGEGRRSRGSTSSATDMWQKRRSSGSRSSGSRVSAMDEWRSRSSGGRGSAMDEWWRSSASRSSTLRRSSRRSSRRSTSRRFNGKEEWVAPDPFLEPQTLPPSATTSPRSSIRSKGSTSSAKIRVRRESKQTLKSERRWEIDDSEDSDQDFTPGIDPSRVKQFKEDLNFMTTYLYTPKPPDKESMTANRKLQKPAVGRSDPRGRQSLSTHTSKAVTPPKDVPDYLCARVKRWGQPPTFLEFYNYLEECKRIQKQKKSRVRTTRTSRLSRLRRSNLRPSSRKSSSRSSRASRSKSGSESSSYSLDRSNKQRRKQRAGTLVCSKRPKETKSRSDKRNENKYNTETENVLPLEIQEELQERRKSPAAPPDPKKQSKEKSLQTPKTRVAMGVTISRDRLLKMYQENLIDNADHILSEDDLWHLSKHFAHPGGGVCDSPDARNTLFQRRERIYRQIKKCKLVLERKKETLYTMVLRFPRGENTHKKDTQVKTDEQETEGRGKSPGDSRSKSPRDSRSKSIGEIESKGPGDSRSKSPRDSRSKSLGKCESKSPGDSKSKSSGDSKNESSGDSKSKRSGDSKSKRPGEGEGKRNSSGKSKRQSSGDSKSKSSGESKSKSSEESKSKSSKESKSKNSKESKSKSPKESRSTSSREGSGKQKGKRDEGGKRMKATPPMAFPGYTLTENELFAEMGLDQVFHPRKLKHSYSFEKMFSHRQKDKRNYSKLLRRFQRPLKEKYLRGIQKVDEAQETASQQGKSPTSSRGGSPTSSRGGSPISPREKSPTHMKEIQAGKTQAGEKKPPPKPPMVLGKMRQFRFLQYRDYAPETLSQSPLPHSTMTAQDFRNRLQQAMQIFEVRKERATTSRQFQSKVSVTFTRRQPGGATTGPEQNDARRLVAKVCQTLREGEEHANRLVVC